MNLATFGIVKVIECSDSGRMESERTGIMGACQSLLLIINKQGGGVKGRGRGIKEAMNNKTYLYPQNSTFGLGTIKLATESKREYYEYFFMSIHRSALPRV